MATTVDAIFDGKVLQLDVPLALPPNTRVRVTIEPLPTKVTTQSFLHTARRMKLEGPTDWSTHVDQYLYDEAIPEAGFRALLRDTAT